ncbi:HNH endonuclease [Sphingobium sp. WCS2017Hpa-17]|uniref:HNH endonuclease n=1 Tax=Sphingobium sp. WCS2017Hpa-17 TaxID=3073638 RepID=UPI00288AEE05|nr:HNH endonuclease [Sphingobium sp. WCS2017Hpa-17]
MSVSVRSQNMLWGRAAGRCAYPGCQLELVHEDDATDLTIIGENCHIVAEKEDGPRGKSPMELKDRNSYPNLILMCRNHHKIIDSNELTWTVEKLHELKREHNAWVQQLGLDVDRIQDDEDYSILIDDWAALCHIDTWYTWTSYVLGASRPRIFENVDQDLSAMRIKFIGKILPGRHRSLEDAFANFSRVLADFHSTLHLHLMPSQSSGLLITDKFYSNGGAYNPNYEIDSQRYDEHVDLVIDLMLELTRAANLVCDQIRSTVFRSYRRKDGHLMVALGAAGGFSYETILTRYSALEAAQLQPYPGLAAFLTVRRSRDRFVG